MGILLLDAEVYNDFIKIPFPPSARGFVPGVLVFTANEVTGTLKSLPAGEKRIKYFTSKEFQNNVEKYAAVMYNMKRGIMVLDENVASREYIGPLLEYLQGELPTKTVIWISVPIEKMKSMGDIYGFKDPYKTTINPLYSDIPLSIAMTRINIEPVLEYDNHTKIEEIIKNNSTANGCIMRARLTKNAMEQLKNLCYSHEKELTGELYVKDVDKHLVYVIDILDGSISSGDHEEVDVQAVRFNFHSHPHSAYVKHSVNNAWPSATDFIGMTTLGTDTIFHIVTTKEGIYVISFAENSSRILDKITSEFVEKNLNIDLDEKLTPEQVIKMVNNVKLDGKQIFQLQFLPWNRATEPFEIKYAQTNMGDKGVCISSQSGMDKHKKIVE
jgi:hypothetical protein